MCGIVGVFGNVSSTDEQRFLELLDVNKIRGADATGIAAIHKAKNPSYGILKRAVHGSDFVEYLGKELRETLQYHNQGVIGHNRLATMGANNDDNAHPFAFGNIVGVHNGVISQGSLECFPSGSKHPVDSGRLFHSLDHSGIDATLGAIHGDWALIWFNLAENKFYFIRNARRPLWYRYADNKKTLWVMSESEMGEWILGRSWTRMDEEGWKQFDVDKLYSLDAMQSTLSLTVEREVKGKEYASSYSNVYKYTPKKNTYPSYEAWRNSQKPPTVVSAPQPRSLNNITIFKPEEMDGLTEATLGELEDRAKMTVDSLKTTVNLAYIELAKNNHSEFVTWRKHHKARVARLIDNITKDLDDMKTLDIYAKTLRGAILRKKIKASTSSLILPGISKGKHDIRLWSDVELRVKQHATDRVIERQHLFTDQATTQEAWIDNHMKGLEEHTAKFVGFGNYPSFDSDLSGSISIAWTKDKAITDNEHRDMCKRVTRYLDYHAGPRLKLWDKEGKRHFDYFDNFYKSCTVRSYGMDWNTPSSMWMKSRASVRFIYKFVREAVEWALDNRYIHPAVMAETLYKLQDNPNAVKPELIVAAA